MFRIDPIKALREGRPVRWIPRGISGVRTKDKRRLTERDLWVGKKRCPTLECEWQVANALYDAIAAGYVESRNAPGSIIEFVWVGPVRNTRGA